MGQGWNLWSDSESVEIIRIFKVFFKKVSIVLNEANLNDDHSIDLEEAIHTEVRLFILKQPSRSPIKVTKTMTIDRAIIPPLRLALDASSAETQTSIKHL